MNLSNTTVVIPAHNRPERLRRLLKYYSRTNIKVLVPDSSAELFPFVSEFPNVIYRHFPKEQFLWKIYHTLDLIETDYVFYCADDDFIVPEAIEKMTKFLDANSDYDSAQGHYLTFEEMKKGIEFRPRYIRNFDRDINSEVPSERVFGLKDPYAPLLYTVIRTKTFKRMYELCVEKNELKFKNLFLAENYFNMFTLIHGKHKTLPEFYCAREFIEGSATGTTVPFRVVQTSPEYASEYEGFLSILISELAIKQNISLDKSREIINSFFVTPTADAINPLKRKIIVLASRYQNTTFLKKIFERRFYYKGLKKVEGLPSYPCKFSTPERDAIVQHIRKYR